MTRPPPSCLTCHPQTKTKQRRKRHKGRRGVGHPEGERGSSDDGSESDSPTTSTTVIMEGKLHKKGARFGKWVERWFVLDSAGALISCKRNSVTGSLDDKKLYAQLVEKSMFSKTSKGPNFCFRILVTPGEERLLQCYTEEERDLWLSALRKVKAFCEKWIFQAASSAYPDDSDGEDDGRGGRAHMEGEGRSHKGKKKVMIAIDETIQGETGWYKDHDGKSYYCKVTSDGEWIIENGEGVMHACDGTVQGKTGWYRDPDTAKKYFFEVDESDNWRQVAHPDKDARRCGTPDLQRKRT